MPLLQHALSITERILGSEHPKTWLPLENYAHLLRQMKREEEATAVEAQVRMRKAAHQAVEDGD